MSTTNNKRELKGDRKGLNLHTGPTWVHRTDSFQLLSERYEMRSTLITSNLPFAKWQTFFKDEMTTAATIDRLVHHSIILELNAESFRMAEAKKSKMEGKY